MGFGWLSFEHFTPLICTRNMLLSWAIQRKAVGKFVTVGASEFSKSQQLSTSEVQQVQYQSLKNNRLQQSSTGF